MLAVMGLCTQQHVFRPGQEWTQHCVQLVAAGSPGRSQLLSGWLQSREIERRVRKQPPTCVSSAVTGFGCAACAQHSARARATSARRDIAADAADAECGRVQ